MQALEAAFEAEHEQLYGHRSDPDNPVEVTALRLVGWAALHSPEGALTAPALLGEVAPSRRAHFGPPWGALETSVIARGAITGRKDGPLLIDEYDSTTVVPPTMRVHLDGQGNIVMEPKDA